MTADHLIAIYGDQAYWAGVELTTGAVLGDDPQSAVEMSLLTRELKQRGYHKKDRVVPNDPLHTATINLKAGREGN